MSDSTDTPQEFAKVTLLIPVDPDYPRPDKWNWTRLADHPHQIEVLTAEFLSRDDAEVEGLVED